MRITRMELHDIGPFDDAVLEFPEPTGKGEIVLFEGPNGSGKTTLAETMAVFLGLPGSYYYINKPLTRPPVEIWARRVRTSSARGAVEVGDGGHDARIRFVPGTGVGMETVAGSQPVVPLSSFQTSQYSTAAEPVGWAAFAFKGHSPSAKLDVPGPRTIDRHPLDGALSFGLDHSASEEFGQFLVNTEFERIQAKLYATEKSDAGYERMAASRQSSLDRIQLALSRVLARTVTIEFPIGNRAPRILFNGDEIPIDLLGEGMRNTISWLADLLVRLERIDWVDKERSPFDQEFWLILDEIEESLHPRMQARILPALRALFPNARIYATTHSPFVVASAGEGTVFRIQPDPKTGRVSGKIEPVRLEPGQSLEWVVSEIFDAPAEFVDERTRLALDVHHRGILALRAKKDLDWDAFAEAREFLLGLNEEVRTVVSMREVPVRALIADKIRERAA